MRRMPMHEGLLGNHEKLRSMMSSCELPLHSARKLVFSSFCNMEITDPDRKRALLGLLMEFTHNPEERKDLETITMLETTRHFDIMLSARDGASTSVFFDYLSCKLVAMKDLEKLSSDERDYLVAVTFSMLDFASRDRRSFVITKRLFKIACESGLCQEIRDIVSDTMRLLLARGDPSIGYSYSITGRKTI